MKINPDWNYAACLTGICMAILVSGCEAPEETARVSPRPGYEQDDDGISRSVVAALKAHTEFSLGAIEVRTSSGDVVLTGELASHEEIDRSLSITMLVSGVRRVESRLRRYSPAAASAASAGSALAAPAIKATQF